MTAAYAAFPYAVGATGLTARATTADHVAQLVEQILFVDCGERVNRPQFGCSLRQLIFTSRNTETTAVVEALVQGALRQWLGQRIQIQSVDVAVVDATITVSIRYFDTRTQEVASIVLTNDG